MENITFNVEINASPQKVWDVLFTDANYPTWTAVFCEGSHAVTDWKEGSKALFLDHKKSGMIGVIDRAIPNEFMAIKGIGEIIKGIENYDSSGAKMCSGSLEEYTLKNTNGKTLLTVQLSGGNFPKDMTAFFKNVWPKALDTVKTIAEGE
ncbi:SRPBCC domain-containing protein [Mucilaginibacter sp. KACC 22773]|uniref:SRPBCC family protein n=1 Tax=Mucilaginibacter sp. KACC 22773 TaxID=3025671 RepID=UPI002366570E|nr:SRPBCC domain-containing protein [Mucilaginibacter sp. KACC 22773]WDF76807.1 SRPBCC domain-containing protein [Mucilaginibacter sp. KACC 22773]